MTNYTHDLSDAAMRRTFKRLIESQGGGTQHVSLKDLKEALAPENPYRMDRAVRQWLEWALTRDDESIVRYAGFIALRGTVAYIELAKHVRTYRDALDDMFDAAGARRVDEKPEWAT